MKHLRQYIRQTILESRFKQMSKEKYTDLKAHLASSDFLDADAMGDIGDSGDDFFSEAGTALRDSLNDYFDSKFGAGEINTIVKVTMMSTYVDEGRDAAIKEATYYFDGLHNVEILIANVEDGTFRDMGRVDQKVYEVVTHELLHMQQFMKFCKGKPTVELWDQFMAEYKKRGGASGMGADYFFFDEEDRASELETFSIQMANELVDALGKEDAVKMLQQQHPDYDTIRKNSASLRNMEDQGVDVTRPEMRDMVKRAKEYAKRM